MGKLSWSWCRVFGHQWSEWCVWYAIDPGRKRRSRLCSRCGEHHHEEADDERVLRNTPIPVRNAGPMRAFIRDIEEREQDAGDGPVLPRD